MANHVVKTVEGGRYVQHTFPTSMGPGTWEVWSPYSFVEWEIETQVSGLSRWESRQTGPLTRACGWTDGGVSIRGYCPWSHGYGAVVDADGYQIIGLARDGRPDVYWSHVADETYWRSPYNPSIPKEPAIPLAQVSAEAEKAHFRFYPGVSPSDVMDGDRRPIVLDFTDEPTIGPWESYLNSSAASVWYHGPIFRQLTAWAPIVLPTGYRDRVTVRAPNWIDWGIIPWWDANLPHAPKFQTNGQEVMIELGPGDSLWTRNQGAGLTDTLPIQVKVHGG